MSSLDHFSSSSTRLAQHENDKQKFKTLIVDNIVCQVDVPLVPASQCNTALKQALNQKKPGVGDRFQLTQGEVCAGTENGKDACTGDGGSPLVCQAQSGRWTVVGLVAWGIGCGSHVPGVYTNVHHYKQWINSIN